MEALGRPTFGPRQNLLLASLADTEWATWQSQLEWVELRAGQILHESSSIPAYAYFPTTSTVSLMNTMQDGAMSETALVGNDGMVGIALFMDQHKEACQAVVQGAGHSYRLRRRAAKQELERGGSMLNMVLGYVNSMIAQLAQTALCNLHHSIEQRFCRRLLLSVDRSPTREFSMTQQSLADLLGVRRESATTVAQRLQQEGSIRYRRGYITVLDRERLERRTCECYLTFKTEYYRHAVPPPNRRIYHAPPTVNRVQSTLGVPDIPRRRANWSASSCL